MVTVRGVELAITDAGTGPPFLYGHGLTSSTERDGQSGMFDWDRLVARHRVVRWDARGNDGLDTYVELLRSSPVPAILHGFAELYHQPPAVPEELLPSVLRGAAASDLPDPGTVRGITAPTLLLAWETDAAHPVSTAERLAELLPDTQLHVAHELDDRAGWTERVAAFLEDHAS